jgi:hypothetical protein
MSERRMITVDLYGPGDELPEAEPVVLEVDGAGVALDLDDGTRLVCDRAELLDALGATARTPT